MIHELRLQNFKAFSSFRVTLGQHSFVVGPNNAGKSTILAAIRTGARMVRYASNVPPNVSRVDGDRTLLAYAFSASQFDFADENIRHEGRGLEARMSLRFRGGNSLTAVWPVEPDIQSSEDDRDHELEDEDSDWEEDDEELEEGPGPYFFLERKDAPQPRRPAEVRGNFPSLGVIPALTPVESQEPRLTVQYVRDNMEGRLSSRHFRNQLLMLNESEMDDFRDFCSEWLPEISLADVTTRLGDGEMLVDVFYTEPERHAEKEISWAGDGIQIWLQLLLHIYRVKSRSTLVLDEPDLYLHPDLQRRLVRLLDSIGAQTITATHSSEVLAEAPLDSVVWVDKGRSRAARGPKAATLAQLSAALGTQFNLRLAKALRARAVLFVEGDDMKILRSIARTVGATRLSREASVAVIPLEGFDNWEHLEPFAWLWDGLLDKSVPVFVVLDRDYRPTGAVKSVIKRLHDLDIQGHVWSRKELESYLLVPEAIARLSGADVALVLDTMDDIVGGMRHHVFARVLAEENRLAESRGKPVPTAERVSEEFASRWSDAQWRVHHSPAKDVLRALNRSLEAAGHQPLGARRIASLLTVEEVDSEMTNLLLEVEGTLG